MKKSVRAMTPLLATLLILSACGKDNRATQNAGGNGVGAPSAGAEGGAAGPADTARTLPIAFAGTDKGRPCRMTLHREWYEGGVVDRKNYRAEVSTSYEHDGEGLGKRTLSFAAAGDGKLLDWEDAPTKQFIKLALKEAGDKIENPASFRVKWLHDDHHHDNTCINLKQVASP